jgi:hypothetical protein
MTANTMDPQTHNNPKGNQIERDASDHAQPQLTLIQGGLDGHLGADIHAEQIPLALQWQIAPGVPAVRPLPQQGTAGLPSHIDVINDEGMPTSVPHPVTWASHMARMVFEVGCGERPATQLNKWVSRQTLNTLALRGRSYARHPATRAQKGMSRLRRVSGVRAMQVAPGIVEASAVLVGTARSHAVAMRMEARGNQWVLTAVEMR